MAVVVARVLVVVDIVVTGNELAAQVRLPRIDAGVENPHDHLRGAGAQVPGLLGVGLRDRPLGRQELVVRNPRGADDSVDLRVTDARVGAQERQRTIGLAAV